MTPKQLANALNEAGDNDPVRFIVALLQEFEAMDREDVIVDVRDWLNTQMQPVTLTKVEVR
jgi:hypothetical protein